MAAGFLAGLAGFSALIYSQVLFPWLVAPAVVGALVGLALKRPLAAAGTALAAWGAGALLAAGPPAPLEIGYPIDRWALEAATAHYLANWSSPWAWAVSFAIAGLVAVAASRTSHPQRVAWGLIALLGLTLVVGAFHFDPPRTARFTRAPAPGSYGYDGHLYVRTWLLMEEGMGFYAAHLQAFRDDRRDLFPGSLGEWRTPVLFTLWKWLLPPDGRALLAAYLVLMGIAMGAGYTVAHHLSGSPLALLFPVLLYPLALFGSAAFWFYSFEFWATALALVSLACYLAGCRVAGLLLALLAALARELLVVYLVSLSVDFWLHRKGRGEPLRTLIPVWAGFALFYLVHWWHVVGVVGYHGVGAGRLFTRGGLSALEACLIFGYTLFPHRALAAAAVAVLGSAGAALGARRPGGTCLALSALAWCALFPFFAHGPVELPGGDLFYPPDYWGVLVTPWMMAAAPVALARLAGDSPPGSGGPLDGSQPGA